MKGSSPSIERDLGEVGLLDARVDVRVAVVVEDAELAVQVEVHRRGLQAIGVEGIDADATLLEGGADVAVGEDAHDGCLEPGLPSGRRRGESAAAPRAARPTRRGATAATPSSSTSRSVVCPGTRSVRSA